MKVLLIDDHPLILAALTRVIEGLQRDVKVTTADSAGAARKTLSADADFELVLLDLQLGDSDGFDLLEELRARCPALPVVVVSGSDSEEDMIRAIDLGAMGFVPKRAGSDVLFEALRSVMQGGIFIPDAKTGAAVAARRDRSAAAAGSDTGTRAAHPGFGLTPRQTEVLALLLQGKPNKLIARELDVSVDTVKDHVAAVLRALKVTTRTQAVLAVGRMGNTIPGPWRPPE
ncbi:MAG: response regulator transcription factor [Burkholderiaceae bacterium]